MIIKICGLRSLEDAQAAIEAGADMLGFNFYPPSPRYVDPPSCAAIVHALRNMGGPLPGLVGVFVNSTASEIAAILEGCQLDLAQLHGDELPEQVAALQGRGFKAIRPATPEAARAGLLAYHKTANHEAVPDLLLDASAPGLYGGSGRTADWSVAAALGRESRLLLAGGLNAGNVVAAVAAVRPWGVDVASGVESAPGVKDFGQMKRFVQRARNAAVDTGTRY